MLGGHGVQFGIVQQLDQRGDVVAALHGAQQFGGTLLGDQRGLGLALGDGGEEAGLDVGGFVDARRDAVGNEVDEEGFLTGRGILQQFDQTGRLLGVQRLGHDALGGTLFYVVTIGFKHGLTLISGPIWRPGAGAPKCIRQGMTGEAAGRTAVAPDTFR